MEGTGPVVLRMATSVMTIHRVHIRSVSSVGGCLESVIIDFLGELDLKELVVCQNPSIFSRLFCSFGLVPNLSIGEHLISTVVFCVGIQWNPDILWNELQDSLMIAWAIEIKPVLGGARHSWELGVVLNLRHWEYGLPCRSSALVLEPFSFFLARFFRKLWILLLFTTGKSNQQCGDNG